MKDQIVQFLGNLPQNEGDQFNKALELYRKSKDHDAGKLRFYNTLGFNKERLDSLLYDLKKQNSITDVEVAQATKPVKKAKATKKENILFNVDAKDIKKLEVVDPVVVGDDANKIDVQLDDLKKEEEKALGSPGDIVSEDGKVILSKADESKENQIDSIDEKVSNKDTDVPKKETIVSKEATDGTDSNDLSTPLEVTKEGDSATIENTKEENDELQKAALEEREKFLKEDLANFDTASEKYNSIKSFAATLSDYIKEDPANQKADTLKAFIEAAKKNFAQS